MHTIRSSIRTLLLCLACFAASNANAGPIDVNYSVTGSTGNWILDFSVANQLGGTNAVYFFGVKLDARAIVGSPESFDADYWQEWSNQPYGGTSTVYNNNWLGRGIADGATTSGFKVRVADLIAPSQVSWFAYAYGGTYTGDGYFNHWNNPGFEGVASIPVPEPGTMLLLGIGLAGAGFASRKRAA
ncbi:MAG: PEP-CTERM sorting domain-containing protein [Janthinobacterium lividum]